MMGFDIGKSRLDINTAWTYVDEFTVTPVQALPENKNAAWVPTAPFAASRFRSTKA